MNLDNISAEARFISSTLLHSTIKLIKSLVRLRFINVSRINNINKAEVHGRAIFRQSVGA